MANAAEQANRGRGNLRQVQRELTRERLVESALTLFASAGYVSTTVDEITTAAGATRATFYLHFRSKADVLVDAMIRLDAAYEPVFNALVRWARSPSRQAIRGWLDDTVEVWAGTRRVAVAIAEAALLEPRVQEARQATFDRGVELLATGLREGGSWGAEQARVRAVLLYAQLDGLFVRWAAQGWESDREDSLGVLTDMWCAALALP
jgi:AcrR family transcriptional regulator